MGSFKSEKQASRNHVGKHREKSRSELSDVRESWNLLLSEHLGCRDSHNTEAEAPGDSVQIEETITNND